MRANAPHWRGSRSLRAEIYREPPPIPDGGETGTKMSPPGEPAHERLKFAVGKCRTSPQGSIGDSFGCHPSISSARLSSQIYRSQLRGPLKSSDLLIVVLKRTTGEIGVCRSRSLSRRRMLLAVVTVSENDAKGSRGRGEYRRPSLWIWRPRCAGRSARSRSRG